MQTMQMVINNCHSYSRRSPGLRSSASPFPNNQLPSPSGTGQASAPIYCLTTLRRPVFLVNSCQRLCSATLKIGRPFFRSYGANLPSSLERVLSRPWVFSTYLPVSVSGTGDQNVKGVRAFLGSMTSLAFNRNKFQQTGSRLSSRIVFILPIIT